MPVTVLERQNQLARAILIEQRCASPHPGTRAGQAIIALIPGLNIPLHWRAACFAHIAKNERGIAPTVPAQARRVCQRNTAPQTLVRINRTQQAC